MFKKMVFSVIFIFLIATNCYAENKEQAKLKIQLVRNATMKITYAAHTFLTDPMLSPKGAIDSFAGVERNPTVELSMSTEEILAGVESVLVTHVHPDHFDMAAANAIKKEMPLFCQPSDEANIKKAGFTSVVSVENAYQWNGITIARTGGKHGYGVALTYMGEVSGFVLSAKGMPTVYWVGDSVWCDEVKNVIKQYQPDIIITHSGGAKNPKLGYIVMDDLQTIEVLKAASKAKVVAIHTESLDHCVITRSALEQAAKKANIPAGRLIIPRDAETVSF